ncbi:MAG: alanine--tRNA ligase [Chloroflexota bacterium]|nr:alanine--tRNA ligase [Chloroflexota bacterium]
MNSQQADAWPSGRIRDTFLRFFQERGHKVMPSAPLVPLGDPTLLFTSAGMVQFKPYFEGRAKPPARRLTSVQKCFRTSDIDSVGDAAHLTFFEMLGNFSVGDPYGWPPVAAPGAITGDRPYFKAEAIPWAWELVTGKDWFAMPKERLWAAVYLDDDEAFDLWRQVGVPAERIVRYGEEHNYWFSGDVGPCGPCSELHYDFGPTPASAGGGCASGACPECQRGVCHPAVDCGRFLEIWNLVFMTYFQHPDGSRTDLPARNIDTGMGLERTAAVLQGKRSVYETDLFAPIICRIEELSGRRYGQDEATDRAMRIVAEHTRAAAFLIGDDKTPVLPSNEERGYAVRRVLRRAIYFGQHHLGLDRPFVADVTSAVVEHMGQAYPELRQQRDFALRILQPEEQRFEETLSRGEELLDQVLARQHGDGSKAICGEDVFLLHDTYGFPMELTREIARERGFTIDEEGFEALMEAQRERARAAQKLGPEEAAAIYSGLAHLETPFLGYETLTCQTTVVALLAQRRDRASPPSPEAESARRTALSRADLKVGPYEAVDGAEAPADIELILHQTPFYAEAGGQVGDTGEIVGPHGRVQVEDTQRAAERLIVHRGRVVEGRIAVNDAVVAQVDEARRRDTMANHTATHLLHAALRRVLGSHVRQAGSLVTPDRLRFDFTHVEALKPEELAEIQRLVNDRIRANLPVTTRQSSFDEAMSEGVLAFFDEKYGDQVRVVEVKEDGERFSGELCGGIHCSATGQIGLCLVVGESSIGAGMRRIEALTGRGAETYVQAQLAALESTSRRLGAAPADLESKAATLLAELEGERKRAQGLERALATPAAQALAGEVDVVGGVSVLAARVDAPSQDTLRHMGDVLRHRLGSCVIVLGSVLDGRPAFMAMVTPDLVKRGLHAGHILKQVAAAAGGGGGGHPEMAQGGGTDARKLDEALALVKPSVLELLGKG